MTKVIPPREQSKLEIKRLRRIQDRERARQRQIAASNTLWHEKLERLRAQLAKMSSSDQSQSA
jgi:hypothetical protein